MYLSRLILNPRDRQARRDLADVGQLHRTILRAFPPLPAGADFRRHYGVLFRMDPDPRTGVPAVLVQSCHHPDWSFLDEREGYLLPGSDEQPNPACKPVEDYYGALGEGRVLAFRLRANVTKKIDTKTGEDGRRRNGRRVALRRPEEQIEWLRGKGLASGGFELLPLNGGMDLLDVRVMPEADAISRLKKNPSPSPGEEVDTPATAAPLTFGSVLFEGRLRIIDREAFLRTLEGGLGSAKAFGFGMLSLARS